MEDGPSELPRLSDLMACVGWLLLNWGQAERIAGTKLASVAELDDVRRLRNDICHTLVSARADPERDREPWMRCRRADGVEVDYTMTQLHDAIRKLERFKGSCA
ncbi:MAG: hypothetical protein ACXU82_08585 [Caulobacteraceae bacterium]